MLPELVDRLMALIPDKKAEKPAGAENSEGKTRIRTGINRTGAP